MKESDFEQKLNEIIPQPDLKTTSALFAFERELGQECEYDGIQDVFNSLNFISRHFDARTTQGVYEIIQHGKAALPGEMVAAAFHFCNCCCTPQQMGQMAEDGLLMGFYSPKEAEEFSPLAVCAVQENGKVLACHTMHFGSFNPETALHLAWRCAEDLQFSVTDALLMLTVDMELAPGGARKLLVSGDEDMTQMLAACFNHCPALAARIEEDDGFEDICVHGCPESVQRIVDGKPINMSAKEFAVFLKENTAYNGGDIRLASCSTGQGDNSFAQQLSKELGVTVKAADSDVYFIPDEGILFVGSPYANTGKWRTFRNGDEII